MIVIGFGGKSGSGKTTAALEMARLLIQQGYMVKLDTFAYPVRMEALEHFGDYDENNLLHRAWMQKLAAALRNDNPRDLVDRLCFRNNLDLIDIEGFRKWQPADFLLVHDIRMLDEFEFCRKHGYVVFMQGSHCPLVGNCANDETETSIDGLCFGFDWMITQREPLAAKIRSIASEL